MSTTKEKKKSSIIIFNPIIGDHTISFLFSKYLICKISDTELTASESKNLNKAYLLLHHLIRHRFSTNKVELSLKMNQFECKDTFTVDLNRHGTNPDAIEIHTNNKYSVHIDVFNILHSFRNILAQLYVFLEQHIVNFSIEENDSKSLYIHIEYGTNFDSATDSSEETDEDLEEEDEDEEV